MANRVLNWARRLAIAAVAVGALAILLLGTQSIRLPIPPAEYKECVEAARDAKRAPGGCKLQETMWDRTLRDPVAYYTLWLTIFTGGLSLVGIAQWAAISRQIKLSEQEFIASHRPRITVRFLQGNTVGPDEHRNSFITIANVGDTDATITAIGGDIALRWKRDRNWMPPGIQASADGHDPPQDNVVRGGEQRTYAIRSSAPLRFASVPDVVRDTDQMAIGEIIYEDRNRVIRRTGFLWYWDTDFSDWMPVQDGGQNYQD